MCNQSLFKWWRHLHYWRNYGQKLDGICNRILRLSADSNSVPLAYIFQQSILSSTYPSTWKCANVTPVYKKNVM